MRAMNPQTPTPPEASEAQRDLAYRRLAAVMLRLDVATLTYELRGARLQAGARGDTPDLPRAA